MQLRPLSLAKAVIRSKKELKDAGRRGNDGATAIRNSDDGEAGEHQLEPGTEHDVLVFVRGRCKCVTNVSK